jgi:hypothetical protein
MRGRDLVMTDDTDCIQVPVPTPVPAKAPAMEKQVRIDLVPIKI